MKKYFGVFAGGKITVSTKILLLIIIFIGLVNALTLLLQYQKITSSFLLLNSFTKFL